MIYNFLQGLKTIINLLKLDNIVLYQSHRSIHSINSSFNKTGLLLYFTGVPFIGAPSAF